MGQSLWSEIKGWAKRPYEDVKDWAHSVYDELSGAKQQATTSSVLEATVADHIKTTADVFETPATAQFTAPYAIQTFVEPQPSTVLMTVTNVETATSTITAAPSSPAHSSTGFTVFLITLGIIAFALLSALAIYVVIPIAARFIVFSHHFLKLCFSKPADGSFTEDSDLGFSSESFSLTQNIDSGDGRSGLDRKAKLRIMWYMFLYKEPFDEARLRFVRRKFAENGIAPDGQPLDPKFAGFFGDNASA